MTTVLKQSDLWGLKVLGVAWPSSLAVVHMQCGESCWSETGYGLWNSDMGDVSGVFKIGYIYACGVCHGTSGDGGIHWPTGSVSHCDDWMQSTMCAFCNYCFSCTSENGSMIVSG